MGDQANENAPPSLFCSLGSESTSLTDEEIKGKLWAFLDTLGPREDVLILPPDYTRFHSQAGKLTSFISEYYNFTRSEEATDTTPSIGQRPPMNNGKHIDEADEPVTKKMKVGHTSESSPSIQILPALGTHKPMTQKEIKCMFGDELALKNPSPFIVHDWRNNVVTIGHSPSEMVSEATNGMVKKPWPAQLNKLVWDRRHHNPKTQPHKSLVLSVGQVVPHEVMGMANFNKNLFVGVGGVEAINLSHFIGAVHGMENMMGRASNPLRSILNYASENFLQSELDLWYILTVMGTNPNTGKVEMRGFYIGNDIECYNLACDLSLKVNFTLLEKAPKKVVVHLDGDEFHSTWLGNKAIYRTRMAIADGGELIILAPGVNRFGEDTHVDELIRKYGYIGTPSVMRAMDKNPELQENLSAVAHLIHGSSEGRFTVTYCPGHLTKEEVEGVGFKFADLGQMQKIYDPVTLKDGWNVRNVVDQNGNNSREEFFYISNPAIGLWAHKSRFSKDHEQCDNSTLSSDQGASMGSSSTQRSVEASAGVGGWVHPPIPTDR